MLNTIALLFNIFPGLRADYQNIRLELEVSPAENEICAGALLSYAVTTGCRIRVQGEYCFERNASRNERNIKALSRDEAEHQLGVHRRSVAEAR